MVKIVDVARHAGVSTATVSRVLNNSTFVAEELRERVEQAVRELGYNLNIAARSLRTRQSSKLLVMVPDISNPFFAKVIRGAEEAAREAGYSVVLGDTRGDPALESQYALMLDTQVVDGLVILGHRVPEPIHRLVRRKGSGAPVVHGCEYSPDLGLASVHIDNATAAHEAVTHLAGLGHRCIGLVTGPMDSPLSRDRLAGAQAAADAVAGARLLVRNGDFSIESGFDHAAELLAEGASAIFCFSDEMALGALHAVKAAGLECPGAVSVVGFDDIRFAAHSAPPLTTVRQPAEEIGRTAVAMLLRRLRGEADALENVTLGHELVMRQSSGPHRPAQQA